MFGIKNIRIMIIAVTIALLALVATQIYWVSDAIGIKKEEYTKNVKSAFFSSIYKYKNQHKRIFQKQPPQIQVNHSMNSITVKDTSVLVDSVEVLMKIIEEQHWSEDKSTMNKTRLVVTDTSTFDSVYASVAKEVNALQKVSDVQMNWSTDTITTINQMDHNRFALVERHFDIQKLDSLFKVELTLLGIDDHYFLIAGYEGQEPSFFNTEEAKEKTNEIMKDNEAVAVEIFEADFSHPALLAHVFFPGKKSIVMGEIWWIMISSGIIIVILIFAFYYSIRTILHQKKLSDVKNDFINNMTHELKTPISTIGLACEMLSDESINTSEPKKKAYIGMIKDENKRLGTLVESVLQSAVIDRGELVLKPEKIEVNELIRDVAANFDLQITKREGRLSLKLNAAHDIISADPVHLSNVIFNLLDNATKYSFDAPEITISTGNSGDRIIISVTDKGIGINKEDQKKIFEKLYRIPTGNVHNVKGFGLGLSYVKAVIEKHEGEVTIDSEPGKGSTFTLSLPIYHGKEN